MAYEIPNEKDTVEIGGIIYGHPHIVMKFPPDKDLEKVKRAVGGWNNDPQFKKAYMRFSVVKLAADGHAFKYDRYTLCGWRLVDFSKSYIKAHPWVEFETYADWQKHVRGLKK